MVIFLMVLQCCFTLIAGTYFFTQLRAQRSGKNLVKLDSGLEMEKLIKMRTVTLSKPLSELVRPASMEEIVGQEEGIQALRAALCGPNPQHVIIYGPPGIGKTCAARMVLKEAQKLDRSPFRPDAKFIEMDATSIRFDERSIADPLIGSIHDPIYQGAGSLGMAGIPQPKPGAVTKANGGVLFLDEIGELHPMQMNKLLKVLEDRKVFFESAYYSENDTNIPKHIHEIFRNGLPADFRLVGATTRSPAEISPALRSRCMEIFFRALEPDELAGIAFQAAIKAGMLMRWECADQIGCYANNGREAVNIVQMAAGRATLQGVNEISPETLDWVLTAGRYIRRQKPEVPRSPQIGIACGMAVYAHGEGTLLKIEARTVKNAEKKGRLILTGIVDEEELGGEGKRLRKKSDIRSSVENVCTVVEDLTGTDMTQWDIHINFPGGPGVDGPSAGMAIACALYSALTGCTVDNHAAMTGEIGIMGDIYPVGGVAEKLKAARDAGVLRAFIPQENMQAGFHQLGIQVIPIRHISELLAETGVMNHSGAEGTVGSEQALRIAAASEKRDRE